jgi:outer membrane protein OmpA-like peptidoglycan-associated protein
MGEDKQGVIRSITEGGVSGEHASPAPFQFFVGPATANEFNTARLRLIPIACLRVDDIRFRFDSSFVVFNPEDDLNDIRVELRELANLVKANPGSPLSVFGHADPVGNDDYNKALSGRRAQAIYGMLIRDPGLWEDLFSGHKTIAGDNWGDDALQTMQTATGLSHGTPHNVLFTAYMDKLCGPDFKLQKPDFLARGADAKGKGDFQGCGEFNPRLIFSQETQAKFDEAARKNDKEVLVDRNKQNAPNRRVMILIFRKGSLILPAKWPCPTVKEGVSGCKKRFFSDGEHRRTTHLSGKDRLFKDTKDTFACRFYQRISDNSPCEEPIIGTVNVVVGKLPSIFSFRRTFPKPSSLPMLQEIARRAVQNRSLKILVIGHTDNTGDDGVDHKLSLGRAAAVAALLRGDAGFFRERFNSPDPLEKWSWEEVQWMLSAIEVLGDPFYAGFVDGHRGDATGLALQSFQIFFGLQLTHLCDEKTLTKLIEEYVKVIGPKRPSPAQIEILGGGDWHPPRDFGPDGQQLSGAEFSDVNQIGFRRVEVFLSNQFAPPPNTCAPSRHDACEAYLEWCASVEEVLDVPPPQTLLIRLSDAYNEPLSFAAIDAVRHLPDGSQDSVGLVGTSDLGLARLTSPPGFYSVRYFVSGVEQRASFFAHPDHVGGLALRPSADAASFAVASQVETGDESD